MLSSVNRCVHGDYVVLDMERTVSGVVQAPFNNYATLWEGGCLLGETVCDMGREEGSSVCTVAGHLFGIRMKD